MEKVKNEENYTNSRIGVTIMKKKTHGNFGIKSPIENKEITVEKTPMIANKIQKLKIDFDPYDSNKFENSLRKTPVNHLISKPKSELENPFNFENSNRIYKRNSIEQFNLTKINEVRNFTDYIFKLFS